MTRRTEIIGIAAVLGVIILSLFIANRAGYNRGRENEKLKANATLIQQKDSMTQAVSVREKAIRKSADSSVEVARQSRIVVREARGKLVVRGDTVNGESLPDVASFIALCDETIRKDTLAIHTLSADVAVQDSLILSLYDGQKVRDERIKLLEGIKRPRLGFRSGFVLGAIAIGLASHFLVR